MFGDSDRLLYDKCYKQMYLDQITSVNKYVMSNFKNNNKCHSNFGPRNRTNGQTGIISDMDLGQKAMTQSILQNRNNQYNKCISGNTLEDKNEILNNLNNNNDFKICSSYLDQNDTRLDNTFNRETEIERYKKIYDNENIKKQKTYYGIDNSEQFGNNRFGINTQLQSKDFVKNPKEKKVIPKFISDLNK